MRRNTELLEQLHKNSTDFEKVLTDAKHLAAELKKATGIILDGMKELSKLLMVPKTELCVICMQHPKKFMCAPCGHTLCRFCTTRLRAVGPAPMRKCFTCRTPVEELYRIYL